MLNNGTEPGHVEQNFNVEIIETVPIGWETPKGPVLPYTEWAAIGKTLRQKHIGALFDIGDWLNYGETRYGETYAQAADELGYKPEFMSKLKYVAKRIPKARRRTSIGLGFGHHQAVASLDEATQDAFLELAHQLKLTVIETQKAVADAKANGQLALDNKGRGRPKKPSGPQPNLSLGEQTPSAPSVTVQDNGAAESPKAATSEPKPVSKPSDPVKGGVEKLDGFCSELRKLILSFRIPALAEGVRRCDDAENVGRNVREAADDLNRLVAMIERLNGAS